MSELGTGVGDLGRGLRFLQANPALWRWVVAPAAVTLVLLVGSVVGVAYLAEPIVGWMTSYLPAWLERLGGWVLTAIVIIGLAIAGLLVFVSIAGMIAGPFNELLSEAVESRLTGRPGARFSLGELARGLVVGIVHGLRRLVVALIASALVVALGFLPVIGTAIAAVLGFWLAARATAYDCYDAVLSRRALSYRAKLAYLARHRGRSLGLGGAVAALLLVPGLNLIALGLGAAGATLAAHELDQRPALPARTTSATA